MAVLANKKIKFETLSKKQAKLFTWTKTKENADTIIANGAVRSGKTLPMSVAYVLWAFENFSDAYFIIGGQTRDSVVNNLLSVLDGILKGMGFKTFWNQKSAIYTVTGLGKTNYFYIFGGSKENSQDRVQGFTASGVFIDEVVLCKESFVNQCTMRTLNVPNKKIWYSCNPDSPGHWFYKRFLEFPSDEVYRINFLMEDNPTMTPEMIESAKSKFSGIRKRRFIDGEWIGADGLIYDGFDVENHVIDKLPNGVTITKKYIGVDAGMSHATTFVVVGIGSDKNVYILDEFYHSGQEEDKEGIRVEKKTVLDYAKEYKKFIAKHPSFLYSFYDHAFPALERDIRRLGAGKGLIKANKDVLPGIALIDSLISSNKLYVLSHCTRTIDEFMKYSWDSKALETEIDKPLKMYDHLMDAIRYAIYSRSDEFRRLLPKD